jgi:hypothetical protein
VHAVRVQREGSPIAIEQIGRGDAARIAMTGLEQDPKLKQIDEAARDGLRVLGIVLRDLEEKGDAADDLRHRLAIANEDLRKKHLHTRTRRATVENLAGGVGLNRTYLTGRAKYLGIDLTPYKRLYGPPPPDPLSATETGDKTRQLPDKT